MKFLTCLALILLSPLLAAATGPSSVIVPNHDFELGTDRPDAWLPDRGTATWISPGAVGQRAISVTGDGTTSNAWFSQPLELQNNATYRLQFFARRSPGGGLPISGPVFCNRDLPSLGSEWTPMESYFRTPRQLTDDMRRLRFGQWEVNGQVAFDAIRVDPVIPVYRQVGTIPLGEGERIEQGSYRFVAPFERASANHARPLAWHQGTFNSSRWMMNQDSVVVYRHAIGSAQTSATITATIGYYVCGELVVSVSRDGRDWSEAGSLGQQGTDTFSVPAEWLPAEEIWVRFTARRRETDQNGPALQLYGYDYTATLRGPVEEGQGATHFLAVTSSDPRLPVTIADVGDALPGGRNAVELQLENRTDRPLSLAARVLVTRTERIDQGPHVLAEQPWMSPPAEATIGRNESTVVRIPYDVRSAGPQQLTVQVTGDAEFTAEGNFDVAFLHASHYGFALPPSNDALALWWCSSGWKVSAQRPVPQQQGTALEIRAAANEAEAAQLVIRPTRPLSQVSISAGDLEGPDGARIASSHVDLLEVRYVPVTYPTDATSTPGLWPDPLPPLPSTFELPANQNLPVWVRVRVPKGQPAGIYRGELRVQGQDIEAQVPVRLEVFGFELPDRMTCQTAFGFDPSLVWKYHRLTDSSQRREVLAKYWQLLADHHISPYNPAPLDPIRVTWQNLPTSDDESASRSPDTPAPEPVFDFSRWDRAMTDALERLHFNTFQVHVPGLGGGTFHERYEPSLHGFAEDTPQYQEAMRRYLHTLETHLREKGWLDRAFVYWFDEPDPKDYEFVMNGFDKLRRWAPGLRRMLTEQVEPELIGGPNLWCPLSSHYDHEQAELRRAAGEQFWWYVCTGPRAPYCTLFIDHPGTELRVWLWQTWQRRIDGILVWQTNYWTSSAAYPDPERPQNPYDDPMGWVSGYSTPAGTRQAWGNGDGRFLYPPESAADAQAPQPILEGPVGSIRLDMLRDGIEDYEYLVRLRALIDARRAQLTDAELERFETLLIVPATITSDMTTFTTDPEPIELRRVEIARAIEQLMKMK